MVADAGPGSEQPEPTYTRTVPLLLVSGPADDASRRLVRRSRVTSYALVGLGAVVLSFAPSVVGEPSGETARVLLHVVRPVVAIVLIVAAVAVQVITGFRWRRGLQRASATDSPAPPPQEAPEGPRSAA